MENAQRTIAKLRKQLLIVAQEANRKQNELQNIVHSQKAFAEEVSNL